MVAGTPDQVKKDLPSDPLSPEEKAARDAVQTYFEVLMKAKPADALDGVVDWKAFHANKGSSKTLDEFKALVRDLHRNGIEVILDVVFNHTA